MRVLHLKLKDPDGAGEGLLAAVCLSEQGTIFGSC